MCLIDTHALIWFKNKTLVPDPYENITKTDSFWG